MIKIIPYEYDKNVACHLYIACMQAGFNILEARKFVSKNMHMLNGLLTPREMELLSGEWLEELQKKADAKA